MRKSSLKFSVRFFLTILFVLFALTPAWANIKQLKAYKEAYPDEKPTCSHCHVAEKPKKADGEHDLNDYGKKVVAIKAAPTAEDYKTAGK